MQITTPYQGFSATSLEELSIQLLRKVIELQKSSTANTQNVDIATFDANELTEAANGTLDIEASVIDGELVARDYFSSNPVTPASGAIYPFNRTTLVDACLHCLLWQHKQELSLAVNSTGQKYISASFEGETEVNNSNSLLVSITLTGIPISVTYSGGVSTTKAKNYLL